MDAGAGDFSTAITAWAQKSGLVDHHFWGIGVEGMWGGYYAIRHAKEFLRSQLLNTRWTNENLFQHFRNCDQEKLQVALHIRRGDFHPPVSPSEYRGRFNVALPIEWFLSTARSVVRAVGDRNVQFTVISDATDSELAPIMDELRPNTTLGQAHRDVSDLLILASADLLICSPSSYSLLAAFLSEKRYLWFEPHLQIHDNMLGIWSTDADQQHPASATAMHLRSLAAGRGSAPRGIPVPLSGELPPSLLDRLPELRFPAVSDLLYYGLVPASPRR
jgi:hypothetical protein